jgi:predicted nucleic acid-binding protein
VAFRYIETSALLAAGIENDATARAAIRGEGHRFASALTIAEAMRTIVIAQAKGRLSPVEYRATVRWIRRFANRCEIVAIGEEVMERVGRAFPVEPIRTLDAIHLATADLIGESPALISIVTRDARIRQNALAMGYIVE